MRTEEDGEIDWFIISNPEDENNNCGDGAIYVTCPHISTRLRKRNLHIAFDDTNGIGTVRELVERALDGTEWTIGECDPNLEADGMTVKIRSYSCTENKGAYAMVSEICEKFGCYPVYHGDGFTVDLRAKSKKNGMLELRTDKNLHSIRQVRNSDEIITRLYVHGQYDEAGYVGIEEVNPTGLPFLMNFDYYREIGAFTEVHEKALTDYLAEMTDIKQASNAASKTLQEVMTELATMWGTGGYVLYMAIDGGYAEPIFGGGADQDDVFQAGDDVA